MDPAPRRASGALLGYPRQPRVAHHKIQTNAETQSGDNNAAVMEVDLFNFDTFGLNSLTIAMILCGVLCPIGMVQICRFPIPYRLSLSNMSKYSRCLWPVQAGKGKYWSCDQPQGDQQDETAK